MNNKYKNILDIEIPEHHKFYDITKILSILKKNNWENDLASFTSETDIFKKTNSIIIGNNNYYKILLEEICSLFECIISCTKYKNDILNIEKTLTIILRKIKVLYTSSDFKKRPE